MRLGTHITPLVPRNNWPNLAYFGNFTDIFCLISNSIQCLVRSYTPATAHSHLKTVCPFPLILNPIFHNLLIKPYKSQPIPFNPSSPQNQNQNQTKPSFLLHAPWRFSTLLVAFFKTSCVLLTPSSLKQWSSTSLVLLTSNNSITLAVIDRSIHYKINLN